MNTKTRNRKIKELHLDKKWTFTKIGKKFSLSSERISQICSEPEIKEDIFSNITRTYLKKIKDKDSLKDLMADIILLSKPDRKKGQVALRKRVIEFLHDDLELPFFQIGLLLNRDHTSIIHLYERD